MARIESVAKAGYYPTPKHLLESIKSYFVKSCRNGYYSHHLVLDPCAADGVALEALCQSQCDRYAIELDATRYVALKEKADYGHAIHGDAFNATIKGSVSALFLNPPYDYDPDYDRLEERFLQRFLPTLIDGGLLIYLVPYYALEASVETLSAHVTDLRIVRFPDPDFDVYKQVVLFGVKTALLDPSPETEAKVRAAIAEPMALPVLSVQEGAPYTLTASRGGLSTFRMEAFDVARVMEDFKPWHVSTKSGKIAPIQGLLAEPLQNYMFREYPVATLPRPAHIASGIASGLFNGRKISAVGKPDLLVKGVFDREFRTIDEKRNKDGEKVGEIRVQQPKLVITALNLETHKFEQVGKGDITLDGLLKDYGPALMEVMAKQCPVMYDPRRDAESLTLAPVKRQLFTAQAHVTKACLALLGGNECEDRSHKSAILLGEIGSGKSTVALTLGKTIGKSILVLCPPHLLTSWQNEIKAVTPEAKVSVLEDIEGVDAFAKVEGFKIGILSREVAKLGHGYVAVTHQCPKCGAVLPNKDIVKTRAHCEAKPIKASNVPAQVLLDLTLQLYPYYPNIRFIHHYPLLSRKLKRDKPAKPWDYRIPLDAALRLAEVLPTQGDQSVSLLWLNYVCQSEAVYQATLKRVFEGTAYITDIAQELRNIFPDLFDSLKAIYNPTSYSGYSSGYTRAGTFEEGKLVQKGEPIDPRGKEAFTALLKAVNEAATFEETEACDEPLYQAVPEPRRYPLSKYICRRHPDLFDFLVIDEAHEAATEGSAQEKSAHRLMDLHHPCILMTGSIMNGYAKSLFTNMWHSSAAFRAAFGREESSRFIDRFGYKKVLVSEVDSRGKAVLFGSNSDRNESVKTIGQAPGVLPLFLFQYLLSISVTLHKQDLALELPPCIQERVMLDLDPETKAKFDVLSQDLIAEIKKTRWDPEKAGLLWGALAELPSYLDRATADTGNSDDGSYTIRYPQSVGGGVVSRAEPFSPNFISVKEEWMMSKVLSELAEGRNVILLSWHLSLMPRYERLLKAAGFKVAVLNASKVPTAKRQDWIDREVVKKGAQVLITNPVAIQTGLNNLVYFATQIWMENPACNPIVKRQCEGRVDRIGQKKESRIFFPVFKETLQERLYNLLMAKVSVSISTDGLDPESTLLASGAVEDDSYLLSLSVGKQLWNLINEAA